MREILFKAKRIDNGEWIEGNLFFYSQRKCMKHLLFQLNSEMHLCN